MCLETELAQCSECSGPGTSGTPETLPLPGIRGTRAARSLKIPERDIPRNIVEGRGIRELRKGFQTEEHVGFGGARKHD